MGLSPQNVVKFTPVINTAAYDAGDQVGGINTLTNLAFDVDRAVRLTHVTVIDQDEQDADLTLFFFDDLPTVSSTNNTALNLTDAEILSKLVGVVNVAGADYQDCAGSHVAHLSVDLVLKSVHEDSEGKKTGNIYCLISTSATPTYSAVSSLKVILGVDA